MIEVDDISRGVLGRHAELSRAFDLRSRGDYDAGLSVLLAYLASPKWLQIVASAFVKDGVVIPHQTWNLAVSLLLQACAFDKVVSLVRQQFSVPNLSMHLSNDIDHNNILMECVANDIAFYVHPRMSEPGQWFAACRFIGILPMLMHSQKFRRRDGGLQVGMLDNNNGGEACFCTNEPGRTLLPDPLFIESGGYQTLRVSFAVTPAFSKREPRAMWRGSTTGRRTTTWRTLPRAILCEIGAQNPTLFDCGITNVVQCLSPEEANEITHSDLVKAEVRSKEFARYRFHIDIDGNSNSWPGLFTKLLSGGAVFKVTSASGYRQWYYDRLKPWFHYIPVSSQMEDLVDKVSWAAKNLERAERIGQCGKALAENMTLSNEMDFALCQIETALA